MVRGGAQENTLATVHALQGRGWGSELITGPAIGPEGSLAPDMEALGVREISCPELVRQVSPGLDFRALRFLVRHFRTTQPQIVHTHTSKAGILGRIAARLARVPIVIHTPHGHVFAGYQQGESSRLFLRVERLFASWADRLVALTRNEQEEHLALGVGRADQWTIIHSGVPLRPFLECRRQRDVSRAQLGLTDRDLVLGCVARLVPVKGHEVLIRAVAQLPKPRPVLVLVGDGPRREELETLATELGLGVGSDIRFVGLSDDVPFWMSSFDLFALTSHNEGMGRVLVEAMAAGLPCIGSGVSGIPDVIQDGVTGYLFPPGAPEDLAHGLSILVRNPAARVEMGQRGRERAVAEFGLTSMVQRLAALYAGELESRNLPVPDLPDFSRYEEAFLAQRWGTGAGAHGHHSGAVRKEYLS